MKELKPCPFCGGKPTLEDLQRVSFWVICEGCGIETDSYPTQEECVKAWNRREKKKIKRKKIDRMIRKLKK